MGVVLSFSKRRHELRKEWLAKHASLLDECIASFIIKNFPKEMVKATSEFLSGRLHSSEQTNYNEFREKLYDALLSQYGDKLYQELRTYQWFKRSQMGKSEAMEYCLSVLMHKSLYYQKSRFQTASALLLVD